jgi:hypothetical protein
MSSMNDRAFRMAGRNQVFFEYRTLCWFIAISFANFDFASHTEQRPEPRRARHVEPPYQNQKRWRKTWLCGQTRAFPTLKKARQRTEDPFDKSDISPGFMMFEGPHSALLFWQPSSASGIPNDQRRQPITRWISRHNRNRCIKRRRLPANDRRIEQAPLRLHHAPLQ